MSNCDSSTLNLKEPVIATVPPVDLGQYTIFKITRNRQTSTTLLLGATSTGNYTNWTTTISNSQGGSDWAGNRMILGSELYAVGAAMASSNGLIKWTYNKWQMSNGSYYYQTADVQPWSNSSYQHPSWEVWPSHSSTGGVFVNWCNTDP